MASTLLPLGQTADGRRLGVYIRQPPIDLIDGAILLYQGHGGFLPHSRHTRDVVRGVAHQGLQVDHVNGVKAVGRPEGLRSHVLSGGLPHAGRHQLYLGVVGDKLQAILISGHSHAVPAHRLTPAADSPDKVIRLPAHQLIAGNIHGVQDLF